MTKKETVPYTGKTFLPTELIQHLKDVGDKKTAEIVDTRPGGYLLDLSEGFMYVIKTSAKHKVGDILVFDAEGKAIEVITTVKPAPSEKRAGSTKRFTDQMRF